MLGNSQTENEKFKDSTKLKYHCDIMYFKLMFISDSRE